MSAAMDSLQEDSVCSYKAISRERLPSLYLDLHPKVIAAGLLLTGAIVSFFLSLL